MKRTCSWLLRFGALAFLIALVTPPVVGQKGATKGEWPAYGADLGNSRYSPLDQINAANFKDLEVAWRFKTDNLGPRRETQFESTPLMVNGVLYSTAGTRRAVVAIDPATGEQLWMHSENEGPRGANAPRQLSGRGLAYWTDGREERILYVTPGYRLIALDAKTGIRIPGFGKDGVVDLKQDNDQDIDLVTGEVGLHATPTIGNDVVVIGAAHRPGGVPRSKTNVKGFIRGFDVRTGKRLWIFHTVPMLGEFGNDTWEKDSWRYTGNTGVWGQVADRRRAQHGVPADRIADRRLLRRHAPGQQPVQRNPRRGGSEDGRAQVALPVRAPRDLGLRYGGGADPCRHHGRRPRDQGHRAADEAGVAVRVRSHERPAGMADRRAAG